MTTTREVKLPSGALLSIQPASFPVSKALYQAILRELGGVRLGSDDLLTSLYKDLFCVGFSSLPIEACLWECFKRCTYAANGTAHMRIDKDTFEPIEARDDYITVCTEVARDNVAPFVKSLYAEYKAASVEVESFLKSKPETKVTS